MKLHADLDDKEHVIEIGPEREGGLRVTVDGREFQLGISEPEPGVFLLKHEGRVYEAIVSESGKNETKVTIKGQEFDLRIFDPKRLRSASQGDHHADGLAEVKTAMPGKVVRILVETGAEVEKGDGVIVVEAMKMQNEMRSPKAGKIKNINTKEGDTVAAGEILLTIE